jgi:hypothetical protein
VIDRQGKDRDGPTTQETTMFKSGADWLAAREEVPTSLRAVVGYYADAGVFDARSLGLKRRVDREVDGMIADAFSEVEEAIAGEFGYRFVSFEYDTKLVLPAKLTLGYLYRDLPESRHDDAEVLTRLAVEALIDGDMRDALNDEEFEDFAVDFHTEPGDRRIIAEIAQEVLQARVEDKFGDFPAEIREAYDWAVERSEAHQEQDPEFRGMLDRAREGDDTALDEIRDRYKYADFEEPPAVLTDAERELPYIRTQYDRVGVIYDAMVEMYCRAGFEIPDAFRRSIVLAIIGAQIWLDDLDDYEADMQEGQLTPVTAEYLLANSGESARESVVEISESYLARAREQATEANSTLTGIATEYIHRDGDPDLLPTRRPTV